MKILLLAAAMLPLLAACDGISPAGQLMSQTEVTNCQADLGDVRPGNKAAIQRCDRAATEHMQRSQTREKPLP